MASRWQSLWARAHAPTDAAALAAFRVLFGIALTVIPTRFLLIGGVERFYLTPTFFFSYWGFEWVRPLPAPWMHAAFVAMAVCGACIALGLAYRAAALGFFLLFTYCELIDVTTYLNHYYLVSCLALLFFVLPLHRAFSIDAWLRPSIASETLPRWMTWLLRFQIGIVYFFAALAKATPDWLLHAQPLQIWLAARTGTPVIGLLLDRIEVAYAMSWAGFLYDLTIPLWLSWRRSRPFAYAVVLSFHTMTAIFFDIGTFPLIMSVATLLFFDPSWPRALLRRAPLALGALRAGDQVEAPPLGGPIRWQRPIALAAIAAWCAFHVIMPLRTHAYGGNVLWHEQGMRWSWRVMCREKNASITYRVRARGWARERYESPGRWLTRDQEREFGAQPDMVLALAHHIRDRLEASGLEDVEVRVDALASLNGRPMARLIDPDVDLARVEDSVMPAEWILPSPEGPPPHLAPRALARAGR